METRQIGLGTTFPFYHRAVLRTQVYRKPKISRLLVDNFCLLEPTVHLRNYSLDVFLHMGRKDGLTILLFARKLQFMSILPVEPLHPPILSHSPSTPFPNPLLSRSDLHLPLFSIYSVSCSVLPVNSFSYTKHPISRMK
jgi:hypothetical protein